MKERIVDENITLISYYRDDAATFPWYQDPELCRQVDNRESPYDLVTLHRMYDYLNNHGFCFYISYRGILIGDVTLQHNSEISIVICKEYQNKHIGRACILEMVQLAKEKGMDKVRANIYSFNKQSRRMFSAIGFIQVSEEWFEYQIDS